MDSDLDLLGDIFSFSEPKTDRVVKKFQPKAKKKTGERNLSPSHATCGQALLVADPPKHDSQPIFSEESIDHFQKDSSSLQSNTISEDGQRSPTEPCGMGTSVAMVCPTFSTSVGPHSSSRSGFSGTSDLDLIENMFSVPEEKIDKETSKFQPKAKKKSVKPTAALLSSDVSYEEVSLAVDPYDNLVKPVFTEESSDHCQTDGSMLHGKLKLKDNHRVHEGAHPPSDVETSVAAIYPSSSTIKTVPVLSSCSFIQTGKVPEENEENIIPDVTLHIEEGNSLEDVADICFNVDSINYFENIDKTATVRTESRFQPNVNVHSKKEKLLKSSSAIPDGTCSAVVSSFDSGNLVLMNKITSIPVCKSLGNENVIQPNSEEVKAVTESETLDHNIFQSTSMTGTFSDEQSDTARPCDESNIGCEDPSSSSLLGHSSKVVLADDPTQNFVIGEESAVFSDLDSLDHIFSQPLASFAKGLRKLTPTPASGSKNIEPMGSISSPNQSPSLDTEAYKDSLASPSDCQDVCHKSRNPMLVEGATEKVNFRSAEMASQDVLSKGVVSESREDGPTELQHLSERVSASSPVRESEDANSIDLGMFDLSWMDEDNGNDDDDDRTSQKQKNNLESTDKSVRKRKKATDPTITTEKEAVKQKFPHSTRRNRRKVERTLLETPDDEIDERNLPIRDLILLAEARERLSIKEATTLKQPNSTKSSGSHVSNNNQHAEEDTENPDVQESSVKLNYHTYMNKPRSERWSKRDTELFYEAIRQFGTNFEMIQQLFPNRTRHQVKLKFKNEERKHPLQIADAIIHRSKDHSHFELVIQQLKAQAAETIIRDPMNDAMSQDATAGDEEAEIAKTDNGDEGNFQDWAPPSHGSMKYDEFDWDFENEEDTYAGKDEYDP